MQPAPTIKLQLLGPFAIEATPPIGSLRRKTRALLAYLTITGVPHTRRTLIDLFCREADAPSRVLSLLLSRLRKQLGTAVLQTNNGTIAINPEQIEADVTPFLDTLSGNLNEAVLESVQTAVSLYQGELLEGLSLTDAPEFELWLLGQRATMRQHLEKGLLAIAERLGQVGDTSLAINYAQRLLQHNPLLEEGHAKLMWLYALAGQREAALRQFEQCQALLLAELGVAPTDELQQLQASIAAGEIKRPFAKPTGRTALAAPRQLAVDFVGRADQLETLLTAWEQAQQTKGQVQLIAGMAGAGKSRLMAALPEALPETAVLSGHCSESTRSLPFQPWQEMIEAHWRQLSESERAALPLATKQTLSHLLPEIGRSLPPSQQPTEEAESPGRLFTIIIDFFSYPAAKPCIFLVDDLQWADETSLQLFQALTRRMKHRPWLLVGAFRVEETADSPHLTMLLADFARRNIKPLQLPPLSEADVDNLIIHYQPQLAPKESALLAERLLAATGGNALFVTAVLQELTLNDNFPEPIPVPDSVRALVLRRLNQMPAASRQLVEALAIVGSATPLPHLVAISGRSADEVALGIELGLQWGLLSGKTAVGPIHYDFPHDLLREAVLSTLTPIRAQRLHNRAAQFLASLAAHQPRLRQEEGAGRILLHAQKGEAYALCFAWAGKAAAHARHIFAFRDALTMLEIGIDAFDYYQLEETFDRAQAEEQLFEMLIRWLIHCESVGKPQKQIEQMLGWAESLFEKRPSQEREATLNLMRAYHTVSFHAAAEAAQYAHDSFRSLGQINRATASLMRVAQAHLNLSQNRRSGEVYAEALELARQSGDVSQELHALHGLSWVGINLGNVAATLDYLQDSLRISRERRDLHSEAQALYISAAAMGFYNGTEEMIALASQAIERFEEIGFTAFALRPRMYIALAHVMRGETAVALPMYHQILTKAELVPDHWLIGWVSQSIGRLYLVQRELPLAAQYLERAYRMRVESNERQNQVSDLSWLGRLYLAQGDVAAALDSTARAVRELDAFGDEFYVWEEPDVLMARAEALAAAELPEEAFAMLERAHTTMHQFAEQIRDPAHRAAYFRYLLNARIETAVSQQQIRFLPS